MKTYKIILTKSNGKSETYLYSNREDMRNKLDELVQFAQKKDTMYPTKFISTYLDDSPLSAYSF